MTKHPAALEARIAAMRTRHRALDAEVARETRNPLPEASLVQRLKRQKLRLRDDLALHEGLLRTLSARRCHDLTFHHGSNVRVGAGCPCPPFKLIGGLRRCISTVFTT
ncbi:YdcH family protein [Solirhodobacter olei]|uniref:YdcH family protein n=1 Tax=Solirhodobacter olei TaxID=2493082 RepID=UPI000FD8F95F